MQRYILPDDQFINETTCLIKGQDARHIVQVMRLHIGDVLIGGNGRGQSYVLRLTEVHKDEVHCRIVRPLQEQTELPVQVSIAQALPKADKMEWVLQKGTELGAAQFIPFQAARTIVKYMGDKAHKKRERWQKIVKEAAEQSQRTLLPEVQPIHSFADVLSMKAAVKMFAWEQLSQAEHISTQSQSVASSFVRCLQSISNGEDILVVIGPEGGLTTEEAEQLQEHDFVPISLGKRILRTETASQYVLASISFYFEQLGG